MRADIPKFSGHLWLLALGLFGLGALLSVGLYEQKQSSDYAAHFREEYLNSIQHAIDLGKNVNSLSDYIYDEIKTPQGRQGSFFEEKALSSMRLLATKSVLGKDKLKKSANDLNEILAKGNVILKKTQNGELELAKSLFKNEYLNQQKSFHLQLDSYKKLLQNKSTWYFSKHFNPPEQVLEVSRIAAGSGFLFVFFLFFALTWRLKRFSRSYQALAQDFKQSISEKDEIIEHNFQLKETLEKTKEIATASFESQKQSENQNADNSEFGAVLKILDNENSIAPAHMESFESLYSSIQKEKERQAEHWIGLKEKAQEIDQRVEANVLASRDSWTQAKQRLDKFSRVKLQLMNAALKDNSSSFSGFSSQLLEFLEELELLLQSAPGSENSYREMHVDIDRFSLEQEQSMNMLLAQSKLKKEEVSSKANELQSSKETLRFELKKAQDQANKEVLAKNEALTKILLLIDDVIEERGKEGSTEVSKEKVQSEWEEHSDFEASFRSDKAA